MCVCCGFAIPSCGVSFSSGDVIWSNNRKRPREQTLCVCTRRRVFTSGGQQSLVSWDKTWTQSDLMTDLIHCSSALSGTLACCFGQQVYLGRTFRQQGVSKRCHAKEQSSKSIHLKSLNRPVFDDFASTVSRCFVKSRIIQFTLIFSSIFIHWLKARGYCAQTWIWWFCQQKQLTVTNGCPTQTNYLCDSHLRGLHSCDPQ